MSGPKDLMPEDLWEQVRDEVQGIAEDHVVELALGWAAGIAVCQALQTCSKHPLWDGMARDLIIETATTLAAQLGGPDRPAIDMLLQRGWQKTPPPETLN